MKKQILYEIKGLYRDNLRVTGFEFGEGKPSLCIVGTMRGNEVQQLYCCSNLVKKFKQLEEAKTIITELRDAWVLAMKKARQEKGLGKGGNGYA